MTFLSQFHFKGNQEQAVTDPSPAIAVTAGAGAGKTLSLVGRYLYLLEQGYPIRSILAITFTEKAAREMRSRIRKSLANISSESDDTHPSSFIFHPSDIDSARIGTIHSLCAEILRAHPAEAGLDPAFAVLEEGLAAALQTEAIDAALAWAASDAQAAALFGVCKENELRQILGALMSRRLDVNPASMNSVSRRAESAEADFHELRQDFSPTELHDSKIVERISISLSTYLAEHLDSLAWTNALSDLAANHSSSPDDKLELARQSVLAHWHEIQQARATQNWDAVLIALTALRKAVSTQGKKDNWDDIETVRAGMSDLRQIYDEHLKFLAEKARFSLDEQFALHLPAIYRLFDQTLLEYQRRKGERQALDFDDLEGLTAQLLSECNEICTQWRSELHAVLVDEFQDTNDRQRQIVYALTGFNPQTENRKSKIVNQKSVGLFIVGDAKQSIYRFRSADVTVFRQVQADVQSVGGQLIDLDLTFRAHKPLLEGLNALLAPVLGETDDPARPYAVPFAPLRAYRQTPVRENIQPPYIEFHLGLGESAEEGRASAAQALAQRLHELHQNEGFAYGEMALLFRSSTTFPIYESALEALGIPFVTVAGRGFYDRPEIRDLLNALAAIADPTDDLALVGLLRSPAFAIPDAEIYKLRFPNGSTSPARIFDSLKQNIEQVDRYIRTQANDGTRTTQDALDTHPSSFLIYPYTVLTELHALAGRAPAAAVLKRLLDLTHYRAILASVPNGSRMIRNVEKLLADAHRSRLVSLSDFLAYVQTLRDVGLREGEAPADSFSSGAVQLMTVHKVKGLEFPLIVIADAAYEHRGASGKVQLADTLLFDIRDEDFHSTAWQLSSRLTSELDEAEDNRLLYVAATRAKEKLLINGHVKPKKEGTLSLAGWLGKFDLDRIQISGEMSTPQTFPLNDGLSATIYPVSMTPASDSLQPASVSPLPPEASPSWLRTGRRSSQATKMPREGETAFGDDKGAGRRTELACPRQGVEVVRADLLEPLALPAPIADEKTRAREADPPQRVWRVVSKTKTPRAPAWLVGRLVHEAIRRWRFPVEVQQGIPGDDFESFLRPFALESGLTDEAEIHATIQESRRLLERLRVHSLFKELDSAERHHEVPYFLEEGRGVIDLLYRSKAGWHIIDFKTDEVRSEEEARLTISRNGYDRQVARYAQAVASQLGVQAKTRLVFLNVNRNLAIFDI